MLESHAPPDPTHATSLHASDTQNRGILSLYITLKMSGEHDPQAQPHTGHVHPLLRFSPFELCLSFVLKYVYYSVCMVGIPMAYGYGPVWACAAVIFFAHLARRMFAFRFRAVRAARAAARCGERCARRQSAPPLLLHGSRPTRSVTTALVRRQSSSRFISRSVRGLLRSSSGRGGESWSAACLPRAGVIHPWRHLSRNS